MTRPVIEVENLSKRYRIDVARDTDGSLVSSMLDWVKAPARNLARLRRMSRVEAEDSPDILWALRDISFTVNQGEIIGLIGSNGAGKSTLLKVLARITEPTSGRAVLRGRVASLLEVGTGFHPELSGRENVYMNGTVLGMGKREIDAKFDEIVEFSGVEKFLDTPVKRYSSGMRMRLAFSVAAHLEPEILFIDEVLAVGDAAFQKKCLGRMQTVAKDGRTVLFVSHNMNAVRNLCQRCVVLKSGSVGFIGDVEKSIDYYLNQYSVSGAARVDTVNAHRQRPFDALQVTHVEVETGSEHAIARNGAPLTVKIDFACLEPVQNVICGYYFETRDGVIPFIAWSKGSCPVEKLSPGNYVATGTIPVNYLAPGQYRLGVIVATDRTDSGDWIPRVLEVTVEDRAHSSIDDYWLQQAPGLLKGVESNWKLGEKAS